MNKKIDSGKIVYKKYFKYPKKLKHIEENFDNEIRALTLVEFLKLKTNLYIKIIIKALYLIILLTQ